VIEALRRRRRWSLRPQTPPGEFPPGWRTWFDALRERMGTISGATADAIVALLARRELRQAPPRMPALNDWQAFATLWRQHWQPASSDERAWRLTAGGVSFVWHVVIALVLLIVTAMHFERPSPVDEEVVQVEYIGEGTPADEGGGPAPSAAASRGEESPAQAAARAQPAAAAAPATPQTDATPSESPAPAAAPQPVAVSKAVPDETGNFRLPPTTLPAPPVQTLAASAPDVRLAPIPERPQAPAVAPAMSAIDVRPSVVPAPGVAVRAVPEAIRAPASSARVDVAVETPRAAAQAVEVQARAIPSKGTSATAAAAPTGIASASPAPASAHTAGPASAPPSPGLGIGPKPAPAPGSWATPRRGDDWGESSRNRPGNGVFDGDGRPRIADGPGSASAGHPPGMITDEIKDIDRAGTWLKRKPFPYEPTRWDRLWKPNQTLLDDWVDKGVKQVGIPIPGTNKRIVCVISILQLGGGCGVSDPDLNEQPATARPPPDVPFKPQLQEGNGATWDKDGKAPPPPKLPGLFAPPKSGVPPGAVPPEGGG
jgi:hypothetical protein